MIVKITEQNQAIYEQFFAKITKAFEEDFKLGPQATVGKQIIVRNLDEYYAHVVDIAKLDGRFLRLPLWDEENELGEEFFAINADTRKIIIPNHFKTNGIAVQEDNLAEIVYFTVDRYFDRTDLYTKDIEIRWSLSPSSKSLVGDADSVKAVFIDDEALASEGKLVFGWPITKRMTACKGTLSFAVCFYSQLSGSNRLYSLNTLPTTIAVNGGLTLDNPSCTDFSDEIMGCLINSTYTPESMSPIPNPVWTYLTWETNDNPTSSHSGNAPMFGEAEYNETKYELVNLGEDDTIKLQANASVKSAGATVNYTWDASSIFADDGEENGPVQEMIESLNRKNLDVNTTFVPVDLAAGFNKHLNYFSVTTDDQNVDIAVPVDSNTAEAIFKAYETAMENGKELPTDELFEQRSVLVASEPGLYVVTAQAMTSVTQGEGENIETLEAYSKQISSTTCIIPAALNMEISDIQLKTEQADPSTYKVVDEKLKDNYLYVPDSADKVDIFIDIPELPIAATDKDENYRGKVALVLNSDANFETIRNAFGYKINEKTGEETFGSPVLYAVPEEIKNLNFVNSYTMTYKKFTGEELDENLEYFAILDDKHVPVDKETAVATFEAKEDLYIEDKMELAQVGRKNVALDGAVHLEGIVVHKLNKTYAVSNIASSKIISTNASAPNLFTLKEDDGTTVDNFKYTAKANGGAAADITYDKTIEAYSKMYKIDDKVVVTFEYDGAKNLGKSDGIMYQWYRVVDGSTLVPIYNSPNSGVTVNENTITFEAEYNMMGSYQIEVTNTFNNTKKTERPRYPLYLGEKA